MFSVHVLKAAKNHQTINSIYELLRKVLNSFPLLVRQTLTENISVKIQD